MGITKLKQNIDEISEFDKEDATKLLVKHYDQIYKMLNYMVYAEIKLKADNLSINYIQGLLQESYDIIQKEDTIKLARDLEELLRKGREWSANFQKIKASDKKKKQQIKHKKKK